MARECNISPGPPCKPRDLTYASIVTSAIYPVVAHGGSAATGFKPISFNNVNWVVNKVGGNMTLISNAVTAAAPPGTAHLAIREQDINPVTLNTDLLAYVTCQDTIGFVQVPLADSGPFDGSSRLLSGQVALSCTTTSMRYKIVAQNGKALRLRGVELDWQ